MKKILLTISIVIVISIIAIISYYKFSLTSVNNNADEVYFEISYGMSINDVLTSLEEKNLIKNSFISKTYVKLHKINNFQAGVYLLSSNMSTEDIINKFITGDSIKDEISVTFIEGKRLLDYVDVITNNFPYSKEEVLEVINSSEYLTELIDEYWFLTDDILNKDIYYPLEGYLFPDTYRFNKNASIKEIIEVLICGLEQKLEPYKNDILNGNLNIHELITLASIVELEGASSSDRSGVAGVFYNRLEDNWTLGSDVTTYYAVQKDFSVELTMDEYNLCNPYNTRSNCFTGLPVGPICGISLDSLKATIYPTDSNYYYFVADKNKNTYYAEDYNEFNKIINELKQNGLWYTY